ncbi:MAG: 3-methyladenine DNA glycosylase [Gemmataceae bacterium]
MVTVLTRDEWQARRAAHRARVRPWAEDRTRRMARGEKHPVYDFLFEYYPFRPAHLLRWSPGVEVVLADATPADLDWPAYFTSDSGGQRITAGSYPSHRAAFLTWLVGYLEAVAGREPFVGCFGLHEWAMVYRTADVRHNRVPLRLTAAETDAVVEAGVLCCTHYDAYRFFTPAAAPRNRTLLTRQTTAAHDQPGCLHATMDLYKWAWKLAPFLPAELTADAFELAVAARELDMRASPYDLRAFGFESVRIETREGREEYVTAQRELARRAAPVRGRLLEACRLLEQIVSGVVAAG